jgi:S-layer homology domain
MATAAVPAQKVVVSQVLDTGVDLNTLALSSINLPNGTASVMVSVPRGSFDPRVGLTEFTAVADLRPTQPLLVNVDAKLNTATRTLTWTLASVDPTTGQPPLDPTVGLLPPSTGGSVFFNVAPQAGLVTGTRISDQAAVVFDANAPLNTPTWLNTIDNSLPLSRVVPLPTLRLSTSFPVQWSGTDVGAGIQDYTVYVSDSGGPFTAWLTNTTANQGTFLGEDGHSYAFYSIARDLVGNVEGPKSTAEATTTVQVVPTGVTAQFSDVPPTSAYFDAANLMYETGVTVGCVGGSTPQMRSYCPNDNVTREQMAAFIVRAVTGETTPALYNPTPYFADVPTTNSFFPHIQKLMELGITVGCDAGPPALYCPGQTIPRWQMAIFMVRARLALHGAAFTTATIPYFADAPTTVDGGASFPFIQRSYEEHVTVGCGTNPLIYCPDAPVTRGQMASFIMRALFNKTTILGPTDLQLTGVIPNTMDATLGTQITVTITGVNTNFQTGDTVTVPSEMLDVNSVIVNSATSITATLTTNAITVPAPQSLVVTTSGQNLTLPLAIKVGTY